MQWENLQRGVTIVTTKVNDQTHGMTANAFMSVSLDPQLITISIDNNAKMLDYIKESGKFAVSILKDEQKKSRCILQDKKTIQMS